MQGDFIFWASVVCLVVGSGLCVTPAAKYLFQPKVGWFAAPLLLGGLVLMTTFKWTEVALKISNMELRVAEANQRADAANARLATIQSAATPKAETASLDRLLNQYKSLSPTPPSEQQVNLFIQAMKAADVTILPAAAVNAAHKIDEINKRN